MAIMRFKQFDIIFNQTHINFQNILPSDLHFLYNKKKKYAMITNRAIDRPFMT
jgi:hypothetical protein